MMDTDILDMLEDIGRSSVARLSPAVTLVGDTPLTRRAEVLRAIRRTVLPRRLEITAANGDCLAIEVNSSRVTDVFRVRSGLVPDFETEARDVLTDRLAHLVSDIAAAPAPLELTSLQPDTALEADDVGITLSEIQVACQSIEFPTEPIVSIVPDVQPDPQPPAPQPDTLAARFFDAADKFALGRILAESSDGRELQSDGICAPGQSAGPNQELLAQFAKDLSGWNADLAIDPKKPQLIVMRPSGGKGAGLAVLQHGDQFAVALHEARKLGSAVNLWTSLKGSEE